MREAFVEYLHQYPKIAENTEHFLFFNPQTKSPLRCEQAWKLISSICKEVELQGNYGTHGLRKAWGYHARMNGVELAPIMYKRNHNSIAYSKRYFGVPDDELEEVVKCLDL